MDPRRFDDLTRRLSTSTSRRSVLKGLAGAALGGLLAQLPGEDATAAPKPKKPKRCLPEGKKSKDSGLCCSKKIANGRCCGEEFGACAVSGCCSGETPICYGGSCVACLLEGAQSSDPDDPDECCSKKTSAVGVCCGEKFGSCILSGCCHPETPHCHDGACVGCLPEGAPSSDPNNCCSLALGDGVCCGSRGGSCAQSGCCDGINLRCDNGVCVDCLPEGAPSSDPAKCCGGTISDGVCRAEECLPLGATTTDPSLCCSLLSHPDVCVECYPEGRYSQDPLDCCSEAVTTDDDGIQVCCGAAGGSCEETGCCTAGFTCCNGICVPICPPPMALNTVTCLCEVLCSTNASACDQDAECCSGSCCNGVCVDTQSDKANCGVCGRKCLQGFNPLCQGGICGSLCGGEFCATGNFCSQTGGAPVPTACCPVCPAGMYPTPWNCGDGVCCCSEPGIVICDGYTCPYQ